MKKSEQNNFERDLFAQAINDALGYPKSPACMSAIKYSNAELESLFNKVLREREGGVLSIREKNILIACLDGALHYVDVDIPCLYCVSEAELKCFKEELEKRWGLQSQYTPHVHENVQHEDFIRKRVCRVCGYLFENFYPWGEDGETASFSTCPCCFTEFGFDDCNLKTIKRRRVEWISGGYNWHDQALKSEHWHPLEQLKNIPKEFLGEDERY